MTKIEWTERVWNPVRGCSVHSRGCTNCYAMKQAHRFAGSGGKYEGLTRMSNGGPVWTGEVRTVPEMLDAPLHWKKPQRVFVNSMSDLFHEDVGFDFVTKVFAVMARAAEHTFIVLTKRPERMREYLGDTDRKLNVLLAGAEMPPCAMLDVTWPLTNVWLGVSVEDQATADDRIPLLLETPAAIRWISYEPALGPIDFGGKWSKQVGRKAIGGPVPPNFYSFLNWIVVGGESGPGARPFDVQWARSTVRQCKDAGVPVFVKQLGSNHRGWCASETKELCGPDHAEEYEVCDAYEASEQGKHCEDYGRRCVVMRDRKGGLMEEWPSDLRVREFPEVRT